MRLLNADLNVTTANDSSNINKFLNRLLGLPFGLQVMIPPSPSSKPISDHASGWCGPSSSGRCATSPLH